MHPELRRAIPSVPPKRRHHLEALLPELLQLLFLYRYIPRTTLGMKDLAHLREPVKIVTQDGFSQFTIPEGQDKHW